MLTTLFSLVLNLLFPQHVAEDLAAELPRAIHVSCDDRLVVTHCTFFFQDLEPEDRTCTLLKCL